MSKSGDPSPSSPKKTSANKKASESKEKIAARPAAKRRLLSKRLCQGCRSGCGKGRRQARCGKKGPGKKSVSGFCLQEGGAVRQKDSGKGA